MQNCRGGGGGANKVYYGICSNGDLSLFFTYALLRVAPSLFFKANKTDYSHFLEKGFALRGLGLKLTVFITWKWPQLYDLFSVSLFALLFSNDTRPLVFIFIWEE